MRNTRCAEVLCLFVVLAAGSGCVGNGKDKGQTTDVKRYYVLVPCPSDARIELSDPVLVDGDKGGFVHTVVPMEKGKTVTVWFDSPEIEAKIVDGTKYNWKGRAVNILTPTDAAGKPQLPSGAILKPKLSEWRWPTVAGVGTVALLFLVATWAYRSRYNCAVAVACIVASVGLTVWCREWCRQVAERHVLPALSLSPEWRPDPQWFGCAVAALLVYLVALPLVGEALRAYATTRTKKEDR